MSQDEKSVTNEAKGRRSPISPILPIDEAIEKARKVYAKDKRAFTDFKTLAGHLGYTVEKKGGRSGRTVSTLKQYGLIDERDGKYRISDTAWKIFEMPEGSEERTRLIKESALRPPMIRKVLDFYQGELPSDATLRSHLLFTEGFNVDSAADFIRVLRRTIELVNPSPGDYNAGEESEGAAQPPSGVTPMQQQPPLTGHPKPEVRQAFNPPPLAPPAAQTGGMVFPLYVSREKQGTLIIPWTLNTQEWELLKKQIENSLFIAKATVLVEDAPTEITRGDMMKAQGTGEDISGLNIVDGGPSDE